MIYIILIIIAIVFLWIVSSLFEEKNPSDAYKKGRTTGINHGYFRKHEGMLYDETPVDNNGEMKRMSEQERKDYARGYKHGYRDGHSR